LVPPTVDSGEVEHGFSAKTPQQPVWQPVEYFSPLNIARPKPQITVRLIACREHFTASDAKPIKFFNAVQK